MASKAQIMTSTTTHREMPFLTTYTIDQSPGVPSAGFYIITPDHAARILETRNTLNRNINFHKIEQAKRDIAARRFRVNGESIIFGNDGSLLDGQHRLHACVATGIPITTLCAFGIEPDARNTIDQGKVRTTGDILQIDGVHDGNNVASIARMVICYEQGNGLQSMSRSSISTADVRAFVDEHPEIIDVCKWARSFRTGLVRVCPPAVLGAARMIIEPRMGPLILDYLHQVASGENISGNDPAFAVRRRLASFKRVANTVALEAIMRGAVAYSEGRGLSRVEIHGRYPAI